MSFQYPYGSDTHDVEPQMYAEMYVEEKTVTIGTTTTEWITSDTVAEVWE